MNTQVLKSKYRLLVLMDKSKASYNALRNAVNLAKLIDGSIDVFQVKEPTNVVRYDNQIASMRAIEEERSKQKKELKNMVDFISKEEGLHATYNFTYGNVKNEIKNHIKKTKPDIVVLGKRKKKTISFLRGGITKDLLKTHNGGILISGNKEAFISYNSTSIGFLNTIEGIEKIDLINDLKKHTKKSHKLFKTIQENHSETKKVRLDKLKEQQTQNDTIIYEFDTNDNTANGMANFISKNDLALLLCMNKKNENNRLFSSRLNKTFVKTIEKTNIPVLILNNN